MKPIATSTSDFADLIRHGGIYVDKTAYFHRLVSNEMNRLLFLARPRRFGKSLMITALKEIFSGSSFLTSFAISSAVFVVSALIAAIST